MNFLGHVFVASWRRGTEPSVAPYAFGSMIPDFVGMARARVEAVDHRETADGVALHHATDDVFHGSSVFLGLLEELQRFQADRGVRRGTAMAVAHVGSELVLDGWLLDRDAEQGEQHLGAVGEQGSESDRDEVKEEVAEVPAATGAGAVFLLPG